MELSVINDSEEDISLYEGDVNSQAGQIVIFTMQACTHCKRAKKILQEKQLAFYEVDVDVFPDRRQEMQDRSGKSSVPQIFFNSTHIGGRQDLEDLIERDPQRFQTLVDQVITEEADENAPPIPVLANRKLSNSTIIELNCEPDGLLLLAKEMASSGLKVKSRTYHMRTYKNCFVGKQAVDWLVTNKQLTRQQAVDLGNKMMDNYVFHHVCKEHCFKDKYLYYRFIFNEELKCLNMKEQTECIANPAPEVGNMLKIAITNLYSQFLSDDGKAVDYASMGASPEYEKYCKIALELQRCDIGALNREEKLAFFINVYNALVIHAYVANGIPSTAWQRFRFFKTVGYVIGGIKYSLDDIEHGILRCNQKSPGALSRPFAKADPRRNYALTKPEPRIHFALVCGAKGCPPVKCFAADDVTNQLELATKSYLESCEVLHDKKQIKVSMLFKWYRKDFGKTDKDVMDFIAQHSNADLATAAQTAVNQKYSLKYLPYDWTTNST